MYGGSGEGMGAGLYQSMSYAYMNFSNNEEEKNGAALGWFLPLAMVLRAQESSQLSNYRRYIRLTHRLIPTLAHM